VRQEVLQLALSNHINVANVTGITNKSAKEFREFLNKISKKVAKVNFSARIGNPGKAKIIETVLFYL